MSTEVEMRFNLLNEARGLLFRHWEERVYVEHKTAEFEERAPKVVSPPTIRRIMKVAEELYGFVQATPTPAPPTDAG